MKHFKKILAIILAVALVAAVAVITVIATDDDVTYDGTIAEATAKLTAAEEAESASESAKSLRAFYNYVGTVDPSSTGYDALIEKYDALVAQTAKALYDGVGELEEENLKTELAAKVKGVKAVYELLNGAPLLGGDKPEGYAETVKAYSTATVKIANHYLASIGKKLSDANGKVEKVTLAKVYEYWTVAPAIDASADGVADFVAAYDVAALTAAVECLDAAKAETDAAKKEKAIVATYTQIVGAPVFDGTTEAYLAFEAGYDELTMSVMNTKRLATDEKTERTERGAALEELFAYMSSAPILDASHEGYATLRKEINATAYTVTMEYYKVTAEAANAFGTAYSEYTSFFANASSIVRKLPTVPTAESYTGSADEAKALIEAFGAEDATEEVKLEKYAELYAYLMATPVDPELSPEIYEGFEAAGEAVSKLLISKILLLDANASTSVPEAGEGEEEPSSDFAKELAKLLEIKKYLIETPVSLEAIDKYNDGLYAFTAVLKGRAEAAYKTFEPLYKELCDLMEKAPVRTELLEDASEYAKLEEALPVLSGYEAMNALLPSLDAADAKRADTAKALNALINASQLSYSAPKTPSTYTAGEVSVVQQLLVQYREATSQSEKNELYAEMYEYLVKNPINEGTKGYSTFLTGYRLSGTEVYRALAAAVDAAEGDAKAEALSAMRAYLERVAISDEACEAYNTRLLDTYNAGLTSAYEDYKSVMGTLHKTAKEKGLLEEATTSDEPLDLAIDNLEYVEARALVALYDLAKLGDDPENDYVAMSDRGIAIRELRYYVHKYPVSDSSDNAEAFAEAFDEALADYDEAVANAKKDISSDAPLGEYTLNNYTHKTDWNDGKMPYTFYHSDNATGYNTGTHYEILEKYTSTESNPDYYLQLIFGYQSDGGKAPSLGYIEPNKITSSKGVVMEFDLSYMEGINEHNGNKEWENTMQFGCTEDGLTTGARVSSIFFRVENGKIYSYDDGKRSSEAELGGKNVLKAGEWTHFIMIYNPDGPTITLYVDYELVGTWGCKQSTNSVDEYVFTALRLQAATSNVNMAFDNFDFYQGTAYRDRATFDTMEDSEKFALYVDAMCDEGKSPTERLTAYSKAGELYPSFANDPALADVVARYEAIDVENDIVAPAKRANLETLVAYGDELKSYEGNVTTETVSAVQSIITKIENYISANSTYLDQADAAFVEVSELTTEYTALIDQCETLSSFIGYLKRFERAKTLAAKTKHYEYATTYYDLGEYRLESNRLAAANDPLVLEFEAQINGTLQKGDDGYVTAFEYYDGALKYIDSQSVYENSKRVIDCVAFITEMEGYEGTEEFWAANFDYINKYILIIRNIVRTGNYDPSYVGVTEAIEKFEEIDVYFYDILQAEHVVAISAQLAKYPLTNAYIEKLGICTFVDNYVASNDVDASNPDIAALLATNEAYKSELVLYYDEYAALLEENTVYFINEVEKMQTYVGYADIKAIYDAAMQYYYEMNADSDEAKAAIAVFEEYGVKLQRAEEASAIFIGYVAKLEKATKLDATFTALVNCSAALEGIDEGIEGVSEALATYNARLAEYSASISEANAEIYEVNTAVCAVRTNVVARAVLAVINKIFNR